MKKAIGFILLLVIISFVVGCGEPAKKVVVEGEEGKQEITVKAGDGSWCQEGAEWKMTTTGEGAGTAKMVIVGIVSGGKYDGYCHVTYDVSGEDVDANIDYYFKEDGSGYQVMEVNGQKFESEWTG